MGGVRFFPGRGLLPIAKSGTVIGTEDGRDFENHAYPSYLEFGTPETLT